MEYSVGDKVEITKISGADEAWGVKVGDVAKVVKREGIKLSGWYNCFNPSWGNELIYMKNDQLKKL